MEQKLVNALFATAISAKTNSQWFEEHSVNEIAEWMRDQLTQIEVYTNPVGSMYGLIVDKDRFDKEIKI